MSEYDLDDKRRWLLGRIDHGADNSDTVTAALYRVGVHIAEAIRQSKGEARRVDAHREWLVDEVERLVGELQVAESDRDAWIETAKSLGGQLTLLKIGAPPQPSEGVERPGAIELQGVTFELDHDCDLNVNGDDWEYWFHLDSIAQIHTYTGQILAYAKSREEKGE